MMLSVTKKITSIQLFIFIFAGLFFGVFISGVSNLPQQFFLIMIAGITFPFIAAIFGDVRRFLMIAIVVSIPLRIDVNFKRIFEDQAGASNLGISITDIFIIVLLLYWIVDLVVNENSKVNFFPRITIPAFLYFEACALTLLWAPRLDLAMLELVQMIKVLLLYFILANQIRDNSDVKIIAWSFLATVAVEALLANMQNLFGRTLSLGLFGELQGSQRDVEAGKMFRVGGTLGHPNRLAMYLELLLPMCLSLSFVTRKKLLKMISYVVFTSGLAALILTGSRGGWIGLVLGLIVFFFFLIRTRQMTFSKLIGPGISALLIITIVALAFSKVLERRLEGDDYGSAESRIPMFQIAFNVINAYPMGGVGINNYQVKMKNYMKTVHALKYKSIDRPVHNMYLLITGETGLIGLSMFLLMIGLLAKTLVNTIFSSRLEYSVIAAGLFGGLLAFLTHGMVDKHSPGGYGLFYAIMAFTAALYRMSKMPAEMNSQTDSGQHLSARMD